VHLARSVVERDRPRTLGGDRVSARRTAAGHRLGTAGCLRPSAIPVRLFISPKSPVSNPPETTSRGSGGVLQNAVTSSIRKNRCRSGGASLSPARRSQIPRRGSESRRFFPDLSPTSYLPVKRARSRDDALWPETTFQIRSRRIRRQKDGTSPGNPSRIYGVRPTRREARAFLGRYRERASGTWKEAAARRPYTRETAGAGSARKGREPRDPRGPHLAGNPLLRHYRAIGLCR
jgi:hypothetical protein